MQIKGEKEEKVERRRERNEENTKNEREGDLVTEVKKGYSHSLC